MFIKQNVLAGLMALCMSIIFILAGCSMPNSSVTPAGPGSNPTSTETIPQPKTNDAADDEEEVLDPNASHPDAPKAPPPDLITGEASALQEYLTNADSAEKHTILLIASTINLSDSVEIKGDMFFKAETNKPVTVMASSLTVSTGSSLQLDPGVTLILTSSGGPNHSSSMRPSINYSASSINPGQIVINNGAKLEAESPARIWESTAKVVIYGGGTIADKLNNWTFTLLSSANAEFNQANYPVLFTPPVSSNYDAYKVVSYVADGLALMESAAGQTRPVAGTPNLGSIASWVPNPASGNGKYFYFADSTARSNYADTLKKIANNAQKDKFTLVIGHNDPNGSGNKQWYENGATFVILSGSLGSGALTVNVSKFPVVLPQGALSGNSDSRIEVESGAYLDIASQQDDLAYPGTFHGHLLVKGGGAVRDSAWNGWPLGTDSQFKIEYNGRIAVGEGDSYGNTTIAVDNSPGSRHLAFQGWLIGRDNDSPKARWSYTDEWGLSGWVSVTREDITLSGTLVVQKDTSIIYNVNITRSSVLTIAANKILDLCTIDTTNRGIYAAEAKSGGGMGGSSSHANQKLGAGTLVVENGAIVSREGAAKISAGTYKGNDAKPSHITGGITFFSLEP